MRVNTAKSIAFGERIHKEFGSWAKVRQATVLRDGVYVLMRQGEAKSNSRDESSTKV